MKNYQKGFAIPIIIAIVAILAVGGGVFYSQNKQPANKQLDSNISDNSSQETSTQKSIDVSPKTNTSVSAEKNTIPQKPTPTASVQTKTTVTSTTNISQNASDILEAQANLVKIAAQYKQMGIDEGKYLAIAAPTHSNILEPGKPVTVVISAVQGASKYEISITKPAWHDKPLGLISADKVDTLLKETTSDTVHTIIVPQTDAFQLNEHTYNGEILIIKALDSQGNVVKHTVTQQGRSYEAPAMDQEQIRILPPPTQPQLLKADKYVVEKEGGTVTLTFGTLPSQYATRKVTFICIQGKESQASIEGTTCSQTLTLGKGPYTKKMIVQGNPYKDRDTAIAVRVQYYDAAGQETNPSGLDDESSVSIKIKK